MKFLQSYFLHSGAVWGIMNMIVYVKVNREGRMQIDGKSLCNIILAQVVLYQGR